MQKICQSCAMPMKQDPKGGGTEADGTLSAKYCSYCYENGAFTQPDFSAQQMQEFVVEQLVKMKFPRFLARLMARKIPQLERWREN